MNITLTKQMLQNVQGKRIKDFKHKIFYKGERPLDYTVVLDDLDKISGNLVTKADSNTIFLDNGYVIVFGYEKDCLQFFPDITKIEIMKKNKKFITNGYAFVFIFNDDSCLVISTNSWTGHFRVMKQSEYKPSEKIRPYDREKFILDDFRSHFKKNIAVIAVCVTSKGFLDAERGFVHEALFRSKIHPKTKASRLTDNDIENLYNVMVEIANEIQSEKSNVITITKSTGKPCPVCGTLIEKENAFMSSIFICPNCQKEKQT